MVKSHSIQWDISLLDYREKLYIQFQVPLWTCTQSSQHVCSSLKCEMGGGDRSGWILLLLQSLCFPWGVGFGTRVPSIFCEPISSLYHLEGSHQLTRDAPCLRSHLATLLPEPGDELKMQQQQITSTTYRAGERVKCILVLNPCLKSLIQMGLNLFLIKG